MWNWFKNKLSPPDTPFTGTEVVDSDQATAARERAEQTLAETRAKSQSRSELTDSLRRLREANHFGAAIEASMASRRARS